MGEIIADWIFNKKSIIDGTIEEGNLRIKDNSNNNNTLEMVGLGNDFSTLVKFSEDGEYLEFSNKRNKESGAYFKTSKESMINKEEFENGYTIEVIVELPKGEYSPWMGILTREGSGKAIGKTKGEVEILTTLSYNDAFQWTGYPKNLDYNPTNWSINVTSENSRDGFHHLAIINNGKKTSMLLNGIEDIRNPKEEIRGISSEENCGWLIGAALWDRKLSSLFTGNIKRIRISKKPLCRKELLIQNQIPTLNLEGSNKEKPLMENGNNYSFVVIPDSQYMGQSNPEMLTSITRWLSLNKDLLNLKMVLHVGDISEESSIIEFENAHEYFGILDRWNVNYMTTPGNHDYKDEGANYRKYFGSERYKNKEGFNEESFEGLNMYSVIKGGGYEYLFISLDYRDIENGVAFAKSVIEKNRDKQVIIFTHDCYNLKCGEFLRTTTGEYIWKNLISKEDNIFMSIAGHEFAVAHRVTKNNNGLDVIEMLVNYQDYPSGGNGWVRILEIDEDKGVYGKTISPWVLGINDKNRSPYDLVHLTSKRDEFYISLDLRKRFFKKS
ncbi:MAG: metallophosphoesterase [Clostridium sp.]